MTASAQQTYPNKPIRVVVAFGPGGIADTIARLVGQKLSERFGQSVVVDNRAGAGGTVGAKLVAGATPDGYTLLVITAAVAVNASASTEAVDPRTQLTPIALAASAPTIFAVHCSATAKNLMEYVRANESCGALGTRAATRSGRYPIPLVSTVRGRRICGSPPRFLGVEERYGFSLSAADMDEEAVIDDGIGKWTLAPVGHLEVMFADRDLG